MRINKKFISVLTTYNFIWIKKAIVLSNNPKHIKASKTVWKETVYLAQGTLFYIRQFVKKNRFLLCNIISLFQSYSCTFISSVKLQNILGSPVYFVFLEEKHFPWIFELFFQGSGGGFSFVLKKNHKKRENYSKKTHFSLSFSTPTVHFFFCQERKTKNNSWSFVFFERNLLIFLLLNLNFFKTPSYETFLYFFIIPHSLKKAMLPPLFLSFPYI